MKRAGKPASDDFGDNRVPGGDKGSGVLDRETGIRQPTALDIDPFHRGDFFRQSGARCAAVRAPQAARDAAGDKNRPALRVGHIGPPGAPWRQWAALARHLGVGGPASRRAPRLPGGPMCPMKRANIKDGWY